MSAVAKRLKAAIQRWGTINAFVEEIGKRDVRGRSRGTVFKYLAGETEPSPTFLREAASVLGVRAPWLIEDSGAMTEEEEQSRILRERRLRDTPEADLDRPWDEVFPGFANMPGVVQDRFLKAMFRYQETTGASDEEMIRVAGSLFEVMNLPREWDPPPVMGDDQWEDYCVGFLQAVIGLLGEKRLVSWVRPGKSPLAEALEEIRRAL